LDVVATGRDAFDPVDDVSMRALPVPVRLRLVAWCGAVLAMMIVPAPVMGAPLIEIPDPATAATDVTVPVFAV
jgi:hypothetical protein